MRPFSPTRRNRKVGTSAQGHGRDNRLVIPDLRGPRRYEELLTSSDVETHEIHERPILFVREKLRTGWLHACSTSDICGVLRLMPSADLASLACVLFRQPSRKQNVINPTWGRLTYWSSIGLSNAPDLYSGPLITLEACEEKMSMRWPRSLSLASQSELTRLREDGHSIDDEGRNFVIKPNPQSMRQTQLYRTLLHELGHWVDFLQKVERPSHDDFDKREALYDAFFARPVSEREAFAHRYATEQRKLLLECSV